MDKLELERCLYASRAHSVVIDVVDVDAVPGMLRVVTIHRRAEGGDVSIEFESAQAYVEGDIEGGGLKYVASYGSIDVLIQDLEEYLGRPMKEWRNFTMNPYVPATLVQPEYEASTKYFEEVVRHGRMRLPARANYKIAGVYWRHIAKYGSYRVDKLLEEQDELLPPEDAEN